MIGVNRQVGGISVSGEPASNVIEIAFKPKQTDGGRDRINRRRANFKYRLDNNPLVDIRDDMMMDHADPCNMPSDSPCHAPDNDCA